MEFVVTSQVHEKEELELLISEVVVAEASMRKALIQHHALPAKAEIDAYHVAIAAVHGVEFLVPKMLR